MSAPPEHLLAGALDLAREIRERRLRASDGSSVWRGPGNPPPGQPVQMSVLGPHLYGGSSGIAMFLAALDSVESVGELRQLSLEAIAPLRRMLSAIVADSERIRTMKLGLGGLVGVSSFLYAFLRISRWLDEPELFEEARNLQVLFTPSRIAEDRGNDIVSGNAGAILALMALDRAARGEPEGESPPLQLASACATHLISRQLRDGGHPGGWLTLPGFPPLSGFAHGAAGICYALLRLYERTRQPELCGAVQAGLAYERSLYSPEHKNWRDMRSEEMTFMTSWCHGAPGIALGRLGALHAAADDQIRKEIGNAIDRTLATDLVPLDHVCCGNMGRAEVLLFAYEKLGDERLLSAARELASEVIRRAERAGGYRWVLDAGSTAFDPSFFTGAAGVGYTLLRLAFPRKLPCVLLME